VNNQIQTTSIAVMDADGRHVRTVVRSRPFAADFSAPQWSPDGKRLVFERHNASRSEPQDGRALFVVNVDGSGLRRITPWRLAAGDHPDWSADGARIVFRTEPNGDDGPGGNVYTVRPDGSGLKQLTHVSQDAQVLSSSFSPDGKWIAFGKTGTGDEPDVFVMKADGTGVRPVTRTPSWDSAPDWGPAH
jgi:Tol biopolymer transport system component